jgi:hypothetical protein
MESEPKRSKPNRKGIKIAFLCASALLVPVGLLYLSWYAVECRRAEISKNLVGELRRFEIGKTTESQIKQLSDRHGGRFSAARESTSPHQPATYDFSVASPYVMIAGSARTLPGTRLWGLFASLQVEHGHLSNLRLSLFVFRSDGFGLRSTVVLSGPEPLAAPQGVQYYVYESHITGPRGEALGVELSPAASSQQRKKAFDLNLSCLTRFPECRHVCETLPSAWKDLTPDRRLMYEDGKPVNDYTECSNRTR